MELAGLGNAGDVQFAKAGGLFQYWIPLFGESGRNNTNDLSSTFTWLPMLTFGLSAEIVTPLPNIINDITNTTKQQQSRIRINDRVFLNNELMLRGFQRRGRYADPPGRRLERSAHAVCGVGGRAHHRGRVRGRAPATIHRGSMLPQARHHHLHDAVAEAALVHQGHGLGPRRFCLARRAFLLRHRQLRRRPAY